MALLLCLPMLPPPQQLLFRLRAALVVLLSRALLLEMLPVLLRVHWSWVRGSFVLLFPCRLLLGIQLAFGIKCR